jgi:hypothetical protein
LGLARPYDEVVAGADGLAAASDDGLDWAGVEEAGLAVVSGVADAPLVEFELVESAPAEDSLAAAPERESVR